MREILFRGKHESGSWYEGDLLTGRKFRWIYAHSLRQHFRVQQETIGQYTGLKDKNGRRIFEGDVVDIGRHEPLVNGRYVVFYDTPGHCWSLQRSQEHHNNYFRFSDLNGFAEFSEVVGNIYDNPELLESKK